MAVKHVIEPEQSQESNQTDSTQCKILSDIVNRIHEFRQEEEILSNFDKNDALCKSIIIQLGSVDKHQTNDCAFKQNVAHVKDFLQKSVCPSNKEEIILNWLKILYDMIKNKDNVSPACSIILDLIDDASIAPAVKWMLSMNNTQEQQHMIENIVILLCNWMVTVFILITKKLHIWIIEFLQGLNEERRSESINRIEVKTIGLLANVIQLPIFRENVSAIFNTMIQVDPDTFVTTVFSFKSMNGCTEILQLLSANMLRIQPTLMKIFENPDLQTFNSKSNFSLLYPNSLSWNNKMTINPINNTNARVGLVNLGNTCYMNSVLQSLVMTKQFSREILLASLQTPLFTKVQHLLALMLHSKRPELTPREFLQTARPPGFLPGHQQDSSEFLGYLLETLHDQERTFRENQNKSFVVKKLKSNENVLNCDEECDSIDGGVIGDDDKGGGSENEKLKWKNESMEIDHNEIHDNNEKMENQNKIKSNSVSGKLSEQTLVQESFGGRVSITHKCLNCNTSSQNIDIFRDLQLSFPIELQNNTNYNVQYLLDSYCRSEKLSGDNKYSCDKCKTLSDGERYIHIIKAPKNLILTLKYFKYDQKFHTRSKLMHKIDLDDLIYLKIDNGTVKYNLYAAVVHSGVSMDSGHYYTYGADTPNSWYKFNDSYVTKTSIDDLQNLTPPNTPYILFYQMVSSESDTNSQQTQHTNQMNDYKLPSLCELPENLRELVNNDNVSYTEEMTGRRQTKGLSYRI